MEPQSEPTDPVWPLPFSPEDWAQTPPAVQAYLRTMHDTLRQLHERVETLEARLRQNSTTSHRPPSSDSPYQKPRQRATTTPRKAGGKPGHPGHRQVLLPPTTVCEVRPERCACGNTTLTLLRPYYTHQVLELPPIQTVPRPPGSSALLVMHPARHTEGRSQSDEVEYEAVLNRCIEYPRHHCPDLE